MNILKDISLESLKRAAEIRQQMLDLENELESLLSGKTTGKKKQAKKVKKKGAKRNLSPEALERIRDAQRRRWAKVKKESAGRAPKKKAAAKRKSK